nr:tetratricopeptide repeat protein [Lachnospiraceae bacterium]
MDINKVLEEYDRIEQTHNLEAIEAFLLEKLDEAEGDSGARFTLLNELIGFYRETSRFDGMIQACRELLILMDEMGITGTMPYATGLVNIGNGCRAAGLLGESLAYFNAALNIYNENLDRYDPAFAPLYNNMALLFQEMGDHESACDMHKKALELVRDDPNARIKKAISHTNLALSLLKTDQYDEAIYN